LVVKVGVRSDPDPSAAFAVSSADGAVLLVHPDGPDILVTPSFFNRNERWSGLFENV
jgi:hypothetical protein